MEKKEVMARLSSIAYKRDDRIKEELNKLGFGIPVIREIKDLKYFITHRNEEVYIGIRGSVNKRNWMRNANCFTRKGIHRGFIRAKNIIFKDIEELKLKNLPTNITGHSLGGAISLLLGVEMKENKYNIKSIYTFGQPRVCKKKAKLEDRIIGIDYKRYVNNLDVVSQVPPAFFGYIHTDPLYYISCTGEIYIKPSDRAVSIDRVKTLALAQDPKELYKDHEIQYYISLLS